MRKRAWTWAAVAGLATTAPGCRLAERCGLTSRSGADGACRQAQGQAPPGEVCYDHFGTGGTAGYPVGGSFAGAPGVTVGVPLVPGVAPVAGNEPANLLPFPGESNIGPQNVPTAPVGRR